MSPVEMRRVAGLVTLSALMSGCAVQTAPNNQIKFGLDEAELLGRTIASFPLGGGGEGRLRVFNGRYSLKVQNLFKVLPIDNATDVRVVAAKPVGDRTLIVLEKAERNCYYKTQLVAIRGTELLTWDIGDCNTQPTIAFEADSATFDFAQPRRAFRFTYRDARLLRGELPLTAVAQPAAPPAPTGAIGPVVARYVPGLPVAVTMAAAPTSPSTPTPAPPERRAAPAPAPTPKPLEFPTQEQKPVRIVLDR